MDTFVTYDIVLAAVLRLNGNRLIEMTFQPNNRNRAYFNFEDTEEVQELNKEYLMGNTLVEPTQFHNEVRSLTTLIKRTQ